MDATQYVLSTGDFDETYVDTRKARLNETLQSEEAQEFLTDITETINSMRLNRSRYHVSDLLKNINQQIQGMTGRNGKGYVLSPLHYILKSAAIHLTPFAQPDG